MTIQIAVRLPDSLVADLDALVAKGEAKSRASVVERALRRELRRLAYAEEARMRAEHPERFEDPDMDAWVRWAREHPIDLD